MKTIKNLFGSKESKKSIHLFINNLNIHEMIRVRGGEGDGDGDLWPPTNGTGSN